MGVLEIIIIVAVAIVWVITIVDIVRRHLGAGATFGWLVLVIVLPFVGSAIYWILRKPEPGEAEYVAALDQQRRYEAEHRPFDSMGPGP